MKIKCSAIKFYPVDSDYPQIVCGKWHCNCFQTMKEQGIVYDKNTAIQGFLTDTNVFVDRKTAMCIAYYENQLFNPMVYEERDYLMSEDIL